MFNNELNCKTTAIQITVKVEGNLEDSETNQ